VSRYYTNNIVIHDPKELPERVMQELTRILMS
jgi:hypothetical protein